MRASEAAIMSVRFPTAQWFSLLSPCANCGRKAAGVLKSDRNEDIGPFCQPCAHKAIKAAHQLGKPAPDCRYD